VIKGEETVRETLRTMVPESLKTSAICESSTNKVAGMGLDGLRAAVEIRSDDLILLVGDWG
jgi:hypothetical protein